MILIDAKIDAPGREQWRRSYAWRPVKLEDGSVVIGEPVEWRYRFTCLFDSYSAPERPANEKIRRRIAA